jgi:dihydrofolate reductase
MKCSVFIATSADGFIATNDGGVDWLESVEKQDVDMGHEADMGMHDFITSVDCMIMGRKCMEVISSFNIQPEHWPYGDIRIIALSNTLNVAPDNLKDKVEMCSGDIPSLIEKLENDGFNMLTWMATVPLLHSSIYS